MTYYRFKVIIEYLGTNFVGWQKQNNGISIQEAIEKAIYKLTKEYVNLVGAGRTDAGVHALGQVAHFDLTKYYLPYRITNAVNYFLQPYPIIILSCTHIDNNFHARLSANMRHYLYSITNRRSKTIINYGKTWWFYQPLNIVLINKSIKYLIGKHDFSAFRASKCQAKSPIKTISTIKIIKKNDDIKILISAKSFLHHMVRNIIGTLVLIGTEKIDPEYIQVILNSKNRKCAGITAPAEGLYLLKIDY